MSDRPASNPDVRTFPPTSGTVAGWAGLVVAVVLVIVVFRESPTQSGVRVLCGALLFAVLTFAFMLRPRVRTRDDDLVLVNPFEDIVVPVSAMTSLQVRSATFVYVGKKRYVGVAVGRKVRSMVTPRAETGGATGFGVGLGFGSRKIDRYTASVTGVQPQQKDSVPDLLEDWARAEIAMARAQGALPGAVRRQPAWWLIGLAALAAVALVVSLLA
ncbi:MAG: hypothetical protein JWO46_664 [Nocardioidaceae bacterium]|nr:hypothetical protein [Nocardioidaceae bacterium]